MLRSRTGEGLLSRKWSGPLSVLKAHIKVSLPRQASGRVIEEGLPECRACEALLLASDCLTCAMLTVLHVPDCLICALTVLHLAVTALQASGRVIEEVLPECRACEALLLAELDHLPTQVILPPIKGYGGLPCLFDLVGATCDSKSTADNK